MDFFQAIVMGVVEGLTEFLPISSTAHLILVAKLLNLEQSDFIKTFEVFIQLGAVSAVLVLFFEKIIQDAVLVKKIIVSFIPAGVAGFFLYKLVAFFFESLWSVVFALFLGGVIMFVLESLFRKRKREKSGLDQVFLNDALGIGVFQILAFIPGVSRAAATIFGGMALGLDRKTAAEFSFLLSLPTILAASGMQLYSYQEALNAGNIWLLLAGFSAAFVTALATIKIFIGFISTNDFRIFGVYRIILAAAFALLLLRL